MKRALGRMKAMQTACGRRWQHAFGRLLQRCLDSINTWWWNEDVQKAIKEKKECYKRLYHDRCANNIEKYKVAKKTAKRAVSEAKRRAYEDLYRRLSTKEGDDIYRMAKAHDRKTRDFNQVKCIKDEREQLLVK